MRPIIGIILVSLLLSCAEKPTTPTQTKGSAKPELAVVADINERIAKLPRTVIDYDRSLLNENEKSVVMKLVEASNYMDEIFWRQASLENITLRKELPKDQPAYRYFELMKGRWDRILENEPFIAPFGEAGKKPAGAGFYPLDMTKEEFEKWITDHPDDEEKFEGQFTVIARQDGKLVAVPFSKYYAEFLKPASQKLHEAAALTTNASLRDFLNKRADAFLSDDYYASDFAWMDLNSPIEIVIGPYEVYEDEMFNYKASFESFVCIVDQAESEKLAIYAKHLADMERGLPIPDQYKNPNRGSDSPIKVVQEIYTAGDARRGIMTAAFNLPNDERVREAKGSKKVLLKNVMEAKYEKTGKPIADRILDPTQLPLLSFSAYFNHTLFHELSHGLGPGIIVGPDGKKVEARILLKNAYSTIEECKADALGVWNLLYAIDNNLVTSFDKNALYVTYTGLIFRLLRHGIGEAHGRANAIQWNWCREKGAILRAAEGRFRVDFEKMYEAIKSLSNELLMIEATGDFDRAQRLMEKYGKANPEINQVNEQLKDLPVDISPVFAGAGEH